jgi:hypothetical protein
MAFPNLVSIAVFPEATIREHPLRTILPFAISTEMLFLPDNRHVTATPAASVVANVNFKL